MHVHMRTGHKKGSQHGGIEMATGPSSDEIIHIPAPSQLPHHKMRVAQVVGRGKSLTKAHKPRHR
ncbi:hypothetical protein VFPPC_16447 [Pochonia chlamydosporia 170]|uniref:Uncharacterized protein n=1 Tax=Pochonia chlamydosporia 170 TaxID=1380566 RepID=A0A179FCN0_METCM|nr:hypothetical protein VFPPC_16447 [Pochonia chlamydosporia 170]OAQ63254.1 hypothetical protein VFPPC_16447 [Pochonia chlamydosporia 170]